MKHGTTSRLLASSAAFALALTGTGHATDKAVEVGKAVEIPKIWAANQHVYTKGNLGVNRARVDELERWMDKNAPNWTVVLMNNANGERFTEAGGRRHNGMDAVEFALGQSLPNKTGFGELKHPETGEANGAYFLLFIKERKLSYHASAVYDNRNLGEARWKGNLDGPAIRAMRGGGRIIDAAKDTITNIDRQLARKLVAAEAARKRAVEHERRMRAETAAILAAAAREIEVAENRAADLAKDLGNPSGDLVKPDAIKWKSDLAGARETYTDGDAGAAGKAAHEVRLSVAEFLALLDSHRNARARLADLRNRLDSTKLADESILSRTKLEEARTALEEALEAHARADSSFIGSWQQSEDLLRQAIQVSEATSRAIARLRSLQGEWETTEGHPRSDSARRHLASAKEKLDEAQLEIDNGAHFIGDHLDEAERSLAEAKRASLEQSQAEERKRAAIITGGSVGGGSLLLLGIVGNRRRRDERDEAGALLAAWDKTLKGKRDGLFALMDRTAIVVGSVADVEERGYTGETLRLAKQTIRDVDELFIMSSCAEDIFARAEALVTPANVAAKGVNFVSARRYLKAVRLLRDEPVRFGAGDQLEAIIKGRREESTGLLGRKEDYEPFAMSFENLIAAFDERAQRAVETLDLIEECWETIPDRLARLSQAIEDSEQAEGALRSQAALDQLFALRPVFDDLLPAALSEHAAAVKLGASDPVAALRGPASDGERMVGDAASLVFLGQSARNDLLPFLEENCKALRAAERRTEWVAASLSESSQRADDLATEAGQAGASEEISSLEEDLAALRVAAENAHTLETQASETTLPGISEAEKLVANTRESLGTALGVAPDSVLREKDRDPSEKLRSAREEVKNARTALDRGAILAARSALEAAHGLTAEAGHLVERSQTVQREYSEVTAKAGAVLDDLKSDLPKVDEIVGRLAANYAPAALLMGPADPEAESRSSTAEYLAAARREWEAATKDREAAQRAYESAQLLHSAELLDRCADRSNYVRDCLAGIREHESLLLATAEANAATFHSLEERAESCRQLADQFHATTRSRDVFTRAAGDLEELRLPAAGAGRDDPFDTRNRLAVVAEAFAQVEAGVHGDQLLYEEAGRSAQAAAGELATARKLAERAKSDGIVDSQAITEGLFAIDALEPELEEVRARLQVAHEDWENLDEAADRIAADASRFAAMLRGELQRAEAAADAITRAARKTREANRWSGGLGVSISGAPGTSQLERARASLNAGDYQSAQRFADDARRAASQAIAAAASALAAQRREERRRREASTSSLFSNSRSGFGSGSRSSFGGGSSFGSRSSSSSSSGFSSSSFSSGSGTSRSGW